MNDFFDDMNNHEDKMNWEYAILAAKLVINGFSREDAVNAIKKTNQKREEYYGEPAVQNLETSEWYDDSFEYPEKIKGTFNQQQVEEIAKELLPYFE
ncbi:hypothetical protein XNC3_1080001 [Xenorhabdus nematophila F1]|uniref:hypothetical protein n=1 Tax=Xenorhabdus nematophila TaxID=628 RepID=UPI00032754C7|nr:hypothetical protein [Xenorhabdus nematophila]CCW29001.1 hypothetical protein XNC3_1080001 [Xenorhabdus nematophila F1]